MCFRRTRRSDDLLRKSRALLLELCNGRLCKVAKVILERIREKAAKIAAPRQLVPASTQLLAHGVHRTGVYMGSVCFEFVLFVGRFAFSVSTVSLYASSVSGIVILLCAFRICIHGVCHPAILFYSGYQHGMRSTRSVLCHAVLNGGSDDYTTQFSTQSGQSDQFSLSSGQESRLKGSDASKSISDYSSSSR